MEHTYEVQMYDRDKQSPTFEHMIAVCGTNDEVCAMQDWQRYLSIAKRSGKMSVTFIDRINEKENTVWVL